MLFKSAILMLVLFIGACLFHWLLLALHARGIIRNEVSVIALPLSAFVINLALVGADKKLSSSNGQTVGGWASLVLCACVLQLLLGIGWQVITLPAVATFPSVVASWVLRRIG